MLQKCRLTCFLLGKWLIYLAAKVDNLQSTGSVILHGVTTIGQCSRSTATQAIQLFYRTCICKLDSEVHFISQQAPSRRNGCKGYPGISFLLGHQQKCRRFDTKPDAQRAPVSLQACSKSRSALLVRNSSCEATCSCAYCDVQRRSLKSTGRT